MRYPSLDVDSLDALDGEGLALHEKVGDHRSLSAYEGICEYDELYKGIAGLPCEEQLAVVMFKDKYRNIEIAQELGVSEATAHRRLRHGFDRLKQWLLEMDHPELN